MSADRTGLSKICEESIGLGFLTVTASTETTDSDGLTALVDLFAEIIEDDPAVGLPPFLCGRLPGGHSSVHEFDDPLDGSLRVVFESSLNAQIGLERWRM